MQKILGEIVDLAVLHYHIFVRLELLPTPSLRFTHLVQEFLEPPARSSRPGLPDAHRTPVFKGRKLAREAAPNAFSPIHVLTWYDGWDSLESFTAFGCAFSREYDA